MMCNLYNICKNIGYKKIIGIPGKIYSKCTKILFMSNGRWKTKNSFNIPIGGKIIMIGCDKLKNKAYQKCPEEKDFVNFDMGEKSKFMKNANDEACQ